jgi:hypothetical protein
MTRLCRLDPWWYKRLLCHKSSDRVPLSKRPHCEIPATDCCRHDSTCVRSPGRLFQTSALDRKWHPRSALLTGSDQWLNRLNNCVIFTSAVSEADVGELDHVTPVLTQPVHLLNYSLLLLLLLLQQYYSILLLPPLSNETEEEMRKTKWNEERNMKRLTKNTSWFKVYAPSQPNKPNCEWERPTLKHYIQL